VAKAKVQDVTALSLLLSHFFEECIIARAVGSLDRLNKDREWRHTADAMSPQERSLLTLALPPTGERGLACAPALSLVVVDDTA